MLEKEIAFNVSAFSENKNDSKNYKSSEYSNEVRE